MRDYEQLAELIGDIHDAALDPSLWTKVLVRITDFVDGQACGLVSKNPVNKLGVTHYYCGVHDVFPGGIELLKRIAECGAVSS